MSKVTYFKAFSLFKEINLNLIANHFGIKKKFEWEDFLILKESDLSGILKEPVGKQVNIFPFGSIVFQNMVHSEYIDVINYLVKIDSNIKEYKMDHYDDYKLETSDNENSVTNDSMSITVYKSYHEKLIATVLAKSVALEKIESDISILLDDVEMVINLLNKGNLKLSDKKLAKTISRVLRFKYNTLSYIMLLDKPDITWDNQDAESLYNNLLHLFELDERYQKIQAKTETLMDIIDSFSTLAQHKKSNNLEWMIIMLIVFEILITLTDYFFKIFIK